MDIKEIALRLLVEEFPGMRQENQAFMADFAEALIESYKAELLKEAGEPVLYAEFAEDGGWLGDASEYADHLEEPHALFTSEQVATAVLKATKETDYEKSSNKGLCTEIDILRTQLTAAQEELRAANSECDLFRKNGRISDANEIATLKDQLAKAEQRVAELERNKK